MSVVFTSGIYSVTLPNPNFGYRSSLIMPVDVLKLDDGSLLQRDEGQSYDMRKCEAEFVLSELQMSGLNNFIKEFARGKDVLMTLDGTGFFPFLPDKGDVDDFTVSIRIINTGRVQTNPFRYFKTTVEIVNTGSFPSYSLPTQVKNGAYTFGSVSGIREPINLFEPKQEYGISVDYSVDSVSYYVDKGNLSDVAETKFIFTENESTTAIIINEIIDSLRTSVFQFKTPAFAHPFGVDYSNLVYSVQLSSNKIEVTHEEADRFSFEIDLINKERTFSDYWQMTIATGEEIQMTIGTGEEIQMISF